MRQPKKVQRSKEIVTEYSETEFNLYLNLEGARGDDIEGPNGNVWYSEETFDRFKTET